MIYIRTKENQEKHDIGVGNLAGQVISVGWGTVRSDLPGNIKPLMINGFIPDVYAAHNGEEYVIEVETADSINTPHAMQQKIAFQAWASASPKRRFEVKLL